MSKLDRAWTIIRSMTDEERRELIDRQDEELCPRCAALLPNPNDENAEEHDCPFPAVCVCGHVDDEHDIFEGEDEDGGEDEKKGEGPDGHCMAKNEDGTACPCKEFEEDEDADAEDEEGEEDEEELR